MILIIYAHPYPQHSHANKRMLEQAGTLDGVEIRSLSTLPDFNIDIAAEQAALARADLVIWQHPMQWYSAAAAQAVDGQSRTAGHTGTTVSRCAVNR
jgi:glutathione-regulated potassium-efflux system ancillary protein KefF